MNLAEKKRLDAEAMALHKARLDEWLGPDPRDEAKWRNLPKTKPASKWWGGKPLAEIVRRIPAPVIDARRRSSSKLDRNERAKIARTLELFERKTRGAGKDGRRTQGALKSSGVEIAKEMLFEWLNLKTGALFPSHETIASATGWSVSTVKRALKALALAGVLHWFRRPVRVDGAFRYKSNAYAFGQRGPRKSQQIDSNGFCGSPASLPSLFLTLRDVASRSGCNLLA